MKVSIELSPRSDRPGQDIIMLSDEGRGEITLPRSKLRPLLRILHSMTLPETDLVLVNGVQKFLVKRRETEKKCRKSAGKPKKEE